MAIRLEEVAEPMATRIAWPRRTIASVAAIVVTREGAPRHWVLDDDMATPVARYPDLRDRRRIGFDRTDTVTVLLNGGEGFALGLGGGAVAAMVEILGTALIGVDLAIGPDVLVDRMERLAWFHFGTGGASALAIAALDLALWDLAGKTAGKPCAMLAGGTRPARLQIYSSGPDAAVAAAQGFSLVKLTLPGGHDRDAIERSVTWLRAQRAALNDKVQLALDCWGGLEPALIDPFVDLIAPLALAWIEEPFYGDDRAALARLAERLPETPLATGEHLSHPENFAALASAPVAVWQPDLRWSGFTHALRIVDLARAAGRDVVPHTSGVYAGHLAGARGLPLIEYSNPSPDGTAITPYHGTSVCGELPIINGFTEIPNGPGFGLELI